MSIDFMYIIFYALDYMYNKGDIVMSIVTRIKNLCIEKEITLAELERSIDIANGSIRRWDTSAPNIKNIEKVADFFNVSIDSLVGRNVNNTEEEEYLLIARGLKSLTSEKRELVEKLIENMK